MPPKKVPFRKTGRTGKEVMEEKKKSGGSKAGFVKKEIAKGNLKKEGGKIVDAKAKTPTPKASTTDAYKKGDQVIRKGKQYLVTSVFNSELDGSGDTELGVKIIKSTPYYKSTLDKEKKIRTLTLGGFNHFVKSGKGMDDVFTANRLVRKAKVKVDLEKNNPDARFNVMPSKNFEPIYKDVMEKHEGFKPK
jgi:hypothetical protein